MTQSNPTHTPTHTPNPTHTMEDFIENAFQALTSAASPAQIYDINPEKIEALYAIAYNHYLQKDFPSAEEIFSFAFKLDWMNPKIIKGYAATLKMQKKFQLAIKLYALAGLLDMEDPLSSFYAAECFFATGNLIACEKALDAAHDLAQNSKQHKNLIPIIKQMKKHMEDNQHV